MNAGREKTERVTDDRNENGANINTHTTTVKHELTRKTRRTHDRSSVARHGWRGGERRVTTAVLIDARAQTIRLSVSGLANLWHVC